MTNSQKRLNSLVNRQAPVVGPESVSIVLTNRCNLNCISCWTYSALNQNKPPIEWRSKSLSYEFMFDLLYDLKKLGVERIIFSGGGDPLIHPQAESILTLTKELGFKVTLISNLTLVKDLEQFAAIGVDNILANFSAVNEASYIRFHPNRKPEDFGRLIDTLELLSTNGKTKVKLVYVVYRDNYNDLEQLIGLASRFDFAIQCKKMSTTDTTASIAMNQEDTHRLLLALPELIIYANELGVTHNLPTLQSQLEGDLFRVSESSCGAGYFYSRIDAEGYLHFCCNPDDELLIGDLKKNAFSELWFKEPYQKLRLKLVDGEFTPGCKQCGKRDLLSKIAKMQKS